MGVPGPLARRGDSVITRLMAEQLAHPEMLSLAAGFTDNAVLPARLVRAALEQGILHVPGDLCFAEGTPHACARLSFGALAADRLPEAARRFCAAAYSAAKP